ncbi:MAG: hypothetical protein A4E72_00599 [Syntrophus sp. PtaU1.Bin208]|nr:MAG: hypothetical protein A4E72_00599 [Syntrophus sp. PtaU1.Bin208]
MKKIAGFVLLVVIAVGLYAAAGPYITLYSIKNGVEKSDPEKISRNVDFPVLRANLKEQLNSRIVSGKALTSEDNPVARAAKRLVSKMADGMVDALVTPAGLTKLVEGERRKQDPNPDTASRSGEEKSRFLQNTSCRYESLSEFSVRTKDDKNREIRFILTRKGLSWKLSNIILPASE